MSFQFDGVDQIPESGPIQVNCFMPARSYGG
jgi:hypothetical protein